MLEEKVKICKPLMVLYGASSIFTIEVAEMSHKQRGLAAPSCHLNDFQEYLCG